MNLTAGVQQVWVSNMWLATHRYISISSMFLKKVERLFLRSWVRKELSLFDAEK
jgi:hypothetical protein